MLSYISAVATATIIVSFSSKSLLSILYGQRAKKTKPSVGLVSAQIARQEVFGVNPDNCSQTYFFGAVSQNPRNGVPDFFQLSFQIGIVLTMLL